MSGLVPELPCVCGARAWAGSPAGGAAGADVDVLVVPRPGVVRDLDDDGLLAALGEVEAAGRRVDAARVALAAEVAERSRPELGVERLSARRGCRNGVELVQRVTGAWTRAVNARIRLGAATRSEVTLSGAPVPARFPAVASALDDGVLGMDAAAAVVDTLTPAVRVAGSTAVQAAEAAIVTGAAAPDPDAAPGLDADSVRVQATVWRAALDPDGTAPTELDEHRRALILGTTDHGLIRVRGLLLPEVAATLERYAHAWTNPRTTELPGPHTSGSTRTADKAAGDGAVDGAVDGATVARDRRSHPQRLHDVLGAALAVATRAADAPSLAGNAPTLVVTVRQEDLAAGRGLAWADDRPVSINAARHTGCAGAIETVILGRHGRVVGLGSRDRCFTGQQRRAIAVRDGGCIIPGCHVPPGWCEVHHVTPHAHDPSGTHTDNGVLLCWHHHRTLDTSGWEIRMRNGIPQVRPPRWLDPTRGWRTPPPPPPQLPNQATDQTADP